MVNNQSIWNISSTKSIQYNIIKCVNIFGLDCDLLLKDSAGSESKRFIVLDHNIYNLYEKKIANYFAARRIKTKIVKFVSGEASKSFDTYKELLDELDSFAINRCNEPIIAIGGGVLTDVVAFIAGSYRRGIPHIKIPTSLMGYIDAAIGIKSGINFNGNKNRIGTFTPPHTVLLDRSFLNSLNKLHILNGVGEIIKLAVIKDVQLFELLEKHGTICIALKFQNDIGDSVLDRAVSGMIEELSPNLYEENLARVVDFGHSFSPVIEMKEMDKILHGEAVVIDVILSSILSYTRNFISQSDLERILSLILKLNLFRYFDIEVGSELLWRALTERTYHRNGLQRMPLPYAIGKSVFVNDITIEELDRICIIFSHWRDKKCL